MGNSSLLKKDKKIIVFYGRSNHLINVFKKYYLDCNYYEISWRRPNIDFIENKVDVVIVCGYDYSSNIYSFNEFIKKNVSTPLQTIDSISKKNSQIIYVDTYSKELKKYTFSRYLYAKNALRSKLLSRYKKIKIISLKTLIDNNGNFLIYGSYLTKILFKLMYKLKILNVSNVNEVLNLLKGSPTYKVTKIKPCFLKIPRTLFVDRILRLLLG